ncbi:recombinase family protein [Isoptericola nanjingensis]|uniref:recombinase family protein n=1 Tax=Isoptericola TaxID=254250 RepID=UPI003D1EB4DC|nr:recombinase family protein [Isoptericola sp. QY 916]
MAITFGYARVSTATQVLDAQLDALRVAGVDGRHVRVEMASGRRQDRPVLAGLLAELGDGDTLVVAKLDRLGRSMPHLVGLVDELERRGVGLRSLSEQIDTASPAGRFMVHMLAALAQMEADLIRERTNEGLAAARARGRIGGRPSVMSPDRTSSARELLAGGKSVAAVAAVLGVSTSTVRRHAVVSIGAGGETG